MDVLTSGTASLREQVAEEVRAQMARRRMSGVQLAKAMGKSQTYLWRRLNGLTAFDMDDIEQLVRLLDLSLEDLFPVTSAARSTRSGGLRTSPTSALMSPGRVLAGGLNGGPRSLFGVAA